MRDLIGLTLVTDLPGAIAINPSIPASTLKEFIDYAKARPGKLNHGSAGTSSATRGGRLIASPPGKGISGEKKEFRSAYD